jgi:hypothetical protein
MYALIEKGYIVSGLQGQIPVKLNGCSESQLNNTEKLISLILEESGLPLGVRITGEDTLRIVPAGSPASESAGKYSLSELMDYTYVKDRAGITKRQMEILGMAFSEEGAEEFVKPRYWAVVPDFIGMPEADAAALCELTGFVPTSFMSRSSRENPGTAISAGSFIRTATPVRPGRSAAVFR